MLSSSYDAVPTKSHLLATSDIDCLLSPMPTGGENVKFNVVSAMSRLVRRSFVALDLVFMFL